MGSFSSSFKRIVGKFGEEISRSVSRTGKIVSRLTSSGLRLFSTLGKDITDEVSRARKKFQRQYRRQLKIPRRASKAVRRFVSDPRIEELIGSTGLIVGAASASRDQDRARKAGLSGWKATKLVGGTFLIRSAAAGASALIGPAFSQLAPGPLSGLATGSVSARTAGGVQSAVSVGGAGGGQSVSFFSGLGNIFSGVLQAGLKTAVEAGTQVVQQKVSRAIIGRPSRPRPAVSSAVGPALRLAQQVTGAAAGPSPARMMAGANRFGDLGGERTSSRSRNGVGLSPRMVQFSTYGPRQLPSAAFRDLPGGVKAGYEKGPGTTFKKYTLETGETVLREFKPRRMNPCNMRALSRSIRRVNAFAGVVKRARKVARKCKQI